MEFDAQDLMLLFDAVAMCAVRPEFADNPFIQEWTDKVATKIEVKLNDMGYRFDGTVDYHVAVH
jgi:pentose-5-phosphate-3-epimerase